MQIPDILAQAGGLQSIARELGISEPDAARGAAALAPAILGGFKKQARAQPSGLEGLGGLLENVLAPQPTDVSRGNDVLGQIFGSKDVSRTVAQNASARSGLDPVILKRMLPMLAMMVAGYMATQRGGAQASAPASGGLGGLLGGGAPSVWLRRSRVDAGHQRRRQPAGRHPRHDGEGTLSGNRQLARMRSCSCSRRGLLQTR